jgi:energy-coupling factor transporter ATP-binding protein EcfA2
MDVNTLALVVGGLCVAVAAQCQSALWHLFSTILTTQMSYTHAEDQVAYHDLMKALLKRVRSQRPRVSTWANYKDTVGSISIPSGYWLHVGRWCWVYVAETTYSTRNVHNLRKTTLTFWGFGNLTTKMEAFLADLMQPSDAIDVYRNGSFGWARECRIRQRSLSTVAYADNLLERLFQLHTDFLATTPERTRRCLRQQQSILLTGPPGTGKTTLAVLMVARFRRGIYSLSLSLQSDFRNSLTVRDQLLMVPHDGMVLIEDIDRLFAPTAAATDGSRLMDLLDALDGIAEPQSQLVVMTANHPEWLPEAMQRPGRVDHVVTVPALSAEQAAAMLRAFGCTDAAVDEAKTTSLWADVLQQGDMTAAFLYKAIERHVGDVALDPTAILTEMVNQKRFVVQRSLRRSSKRDPTRPI